MGYGLIMIVTLLLFNTINIFAIGELPNYKNNHEMTDQYLMEPGQNYIEPGLTPEMSREEAMDIVEKTLSKYVGIDLKNRDFQVGTEYRRDWQRPENYVWVVHLYYHDPAEYVTASITLDASKGAILELNYDAGQYTNVGRAPLSLTKSEARTRAEDYIRSLAPGKLEQSTKVESEAYSHYGSSTVYSFQYTGEFNNIPYDSNYIHITIDGTDGSLKSYNHRWDEETALPSMEGIIHKTEAESILEGDSEVELFYLPLRSDFHYEMVPENFRIAYRLKNHGMTGMIDAHSGKMLDWSGNEVDQKATKIDLSREQKEKIYGQASRPETRSQPLNQKDAETLAKEKLKNMIGDSITILTSQYTEGEGYWESSGRKTWTVEFSVEKEDEISNGRLMIDADTAEIIAYNQWDYHPITSLENDSETLSWEEGYEKAIELIETHHPYLIKEIRTEQSMTDGGLWGDRPEWISPEYNYHFPRIIGKAVYDENSIMVSIDRHTGEVKNYTVRWTPSLTLPTQEDLLKPDQALDLLKNQFTLELAYIRVNENVNTENPKERIRLVYRWRPSERSSLASYLDAKDGSFIDYSGRKIAVNDKESFEAAISGHWVERTAQLLAQQGILDIDGFEPDQSIARIDAIKMMVRLLENSGFQRYQVAGAEDVHFEDVMEQDEDFRFIQWAIRYGIIDNKPEIFHREADVSREEMTQMIVNLLGYKELSAATHIFTLDYNDADNISEEYWGAIAISKGLGLISAETFEFRPKEATTMAEMAEMLYQASSYLK